MTTPNLSWESEVTNARLVYAEGQLLIIDAILARRPALASCTSRSAAIEHCINTAKQCDDALLTVKYSADMSDQMFARIQALEAFVASIVASQDAGNDAEFRSITTTAAIQMQIDAT